MGQKRTRRRTGSFSWLRRPPGITGSPHRQRMRSYPDVERQYSGSMESLWPIPGTGGIASQPTPDLVGELERAYTDVEEQERLEAQRQEAARLEEERQRQEAERQRQEAEAAALREIEEREARAAQERMEEERRLEEESRVDPAGVLPSPDVAVEAREAEVLENRFGDYQMRGRPDVSQNVPSETMEELWSTGREQPQSPVTTSVDPWLRGDLTGDYPSRSDIDVPDEGFVGPKINQYPLQSLTQPRLTPDAPIRRSSLPPYEGFVGPIEGNQTTVTAQDPDSIQPRLTPDAPIRSSPLPPYEGFVGPIEGNQTTVTAPFLDSDIQETLTPPEQLAQWPEDTPAEILGPLTSDRGNEAVTANALLNVDETTNQTWREIIDEAARDSNERYGLAELGLQVRPESIIALMEQENGPWEPEKIGDTGQRESSYGLGQVKLSTAGDYFPGEELDLLNPRDNIRVTVEHFSKLLKKYKREDYAHLAYNAGEGRIDGALDENGRVQMDELHPNSQKYLNEVYQRLQRRAGGRSDDATGADQEALQDFAMDPQAQPTGGDSEEQAHKERYTRQVMEQTGLVLDPDGFPLSKDRPFILHNEFDDTEHVELVMGRQFVDEGILDRSEVDPGAVYLIPTVIDGRVHPLDAQRGFVLRHAANRMRGGWVFPNFKGDYDAESVAIATGARRRRIEQVQWAKRMEQRLQNQFPDLTPAQREEKKRNTLKFTRAGSIGVMGAEDTPDEEFSIHPAEWEYPPQAVGPPSTLATGAKRPATGGFSRRRPEIEAHHAARAEHLAWVDEQKAAHAVPGGGPEQPLSTGDAFNPRAADEYLEKMRVENKEPDWAKVAELSFGLKKFGEVTGIPGGILSEKTVDVDYELQEGEVFLDDGRAQERGIRARRLVEYVDRSDGARARSWFERASQGMSHMWRSAATTVKWTLAETVTAEKNQKALSKIYSEILQGYADERPVYLDEELPKFFSKGEGSAWDSPDEFVRWLNHGSATVAASAVPIVVAGAATALAITAAGLSTPVTFPALLGGGTYATATLGSLAVGGVLSATLGVSEVRGILHELDPDKVAPWTVLGAGSAIGLVDMIFTGKVGTSVARLVGKDYSEAIMRRALKIPLDSRLVNRLSKGAVKGTNLEFGTEFIQGSTAQLVAYQIAGVDIPWKEIAQEAGEEAALGAMFGFSGGLVNGMPDPMKTKMVELQQRARAAQQVIDSTDANTSRHIAAQADFEKTKLAAVSLVAVENQRRNATFEEDQARLTTQRDQLQQEAKTAPTEEARDRARYTSEKVQEEINASVKHQNALNEEDQSSSYANKKEAARQIAEESGLTKEEKARWAVVNGMRQRDIRAQERTKLDPKNPNEWAAHVVGEEETDSDTLHLEDEQDQDDWIRLNGKIDMGLFLILTGNIDQVTPKGIDKFGKGLLEGFTPTASEWKEALGSVKSNMVHAYNRVAYQRETGKNWSDGLSEAMDVSGKTSGPYIDWMAKKGEDGYVDEHGRVQNEKWRQEQADAVAVSQEETLARTAKPSNTAAYKYYEKLLQQLENANKQVRAVTQPNQVKQRTENAAKVGAKIQQAVVGFGRALQSYKTNPEGAQAAFDALMEHSGENAESALMLGRLAQNETLLNNISGADVDAVSMLEAAVEIAAKAAPTDVRAVEIQIDALTLLGKQALEIAGEVASGKAPLTNKKILEAQKKSREYFGRAVALEKNPNIGKAAKSNVATARQAVGRMDQQEESIKGLQPARTHEDQTKRDAQEQAAEESSGDAAVVSDPQVTEKAAADRIQDLKAAAARQVTETAAKIEADRIQDLSDKANEILGGRVPSEVSLPSEVSFNTPTDKETLKNIVLAQAERVRPIEAMDLSPEDAKKEQAAREAAFDKMYDDVVTRKESESDVEGFEYRGQEVERILRRIGQEGGINKSSLGEDQLERLENRDKRGRKIRSIAGVAGVINIHGNGSSLDRMATDLAREEVALTDADGELYFTENRGTDGLIQFLEDAVNVDTSKPAGVVSLKDLRGRGVDLKTDWWMEQEGDPTTEERAEDIKERLKEFTENHEKTTKEIAAIEEDLEKHDSETAKEIAAIDQVLETTIKDDEKGSLTKQRKELETTKNDERQKLISRREELFDRLENIAATGERLGNNLADLPTQQQVRQVTSPPHVYTATEIGQMARARNVKPSVIMAEFDQRGIPYEGSDQPSLTEAESVRDEGQKTPSVAEAPLTLEGESVSEKEGKTESFWGKLFSRLKTNLYMITPEEQEEAKTNKWVARGIKFKERVLGVHATDEKARKKLNQGKTPETEVDLGETEPGDTRNLPFEPNEVTSDEQVVKGMHGPSLLKLASELMTLINPKVTLPGGRTVRSHPKVRSESDMPGITASFDPFAALRAAPEAWRLLRGGVLPRKVRIPKEFYQTFLGVIEAMKLGSESDIREQQGTSIEDDIRILKEGSAEVDKDGTSVLVESGILNDWVGTMRQISDAILSGDAENVLGRKLTETEAVELRGQATEFELALKEDQAQGYGISMYLNSEAFSEGPNSISSSEQAFTLGHEIGHLVDFMERSFPSFGRQGSVPSKQNLLGKLLGPLRDVRGEFRKEQYTDKDGNVTDAQIKEELLALRERTRPEKKMTAEFAAYIETLRRESSNASPTEQARILEAVKAQFDYGETVVDNSTGKMVKTTLDSVLKDLKEKGPKYADTASELYADAVGMMLTNPSLVKDIAPTFMKLWARSLKAKGHLGKGAFGVKWNKILLLLQAQNEAEFLSGELTAGMKEAQHIKELAERRFETQMDQQYADDRVLDGDGFIDREGMLFGDWKTGLLHDWFGKHIKRIRVDIPRGTLRVEDQQEKASKADPQPRVPTAEETPSMSGEAIGAIARKLGRSAHWLQRTFVDRSDAIVRRQRRLVGRLIAQAIETGGKQSPYMNMVARQLQEGHDPEVLLRDRAWASGPTLAFQERYIDPIQKNLEEAGITWGEFGKVVTLHRIESGNRRNVPNPYGLNRRNSKETLALISKQMGPEKTALVNEQLRLFQEAIFDTVEMAGESGIWSAEFVDKVKDKRDKGEFYATFQSINHLMEQVDPVIYANAGMIEPTLNPADATFLKMTAIRRAAMLNIPKRGIVQLMTGELDANIDPEGPRDISKTVPKEFKHQFLGKDVADIELGNPEDENHIIGKVATKTEDGKTPPGTERFKAKITAKGSGEPRYRVLYWENGEKKAVFVERYVAMVLNKQDAGATLHATMRAFQASNSAFFRPIYTTYSLGFQVANFERDVFRFWKAMSIRRDYAGWQRGPKWLDKYPHVQRAVRATLKLPGMAGRSNENLSFFEAIKLYHDVHPIARARAWGQREDRRDWKKGGVKFKELTERQAKEAEWGFEGQLRLKEVGVLGTSFNQYQRRDTKRSSRYEDALSVEQGTYGSGRVTGTTQNVPKPLFGTAGAQKVWQGMKETANFISDLGDYIETLPKAAAAVHITESIGKEAESWAKRHRGLLTTERRLQSIDFRKLSGRQRLFIRERVGSPDFLAGGEWKPISNELLLYSNAITQAWRGDMKTMIEPETRFGHAMKFTINTVLPSVIKAAAVMGLMDDEEKPEEERLSYIMRGFSEYQLRNFHILPVMAVLESGYSLAFKIQPNDFDRVFGGIIYETTKTGIRALDAGNQTDSGPGLLELALKLVQDIATYSGSQMPGGAPIIATAGAALSLLVSDDTRDPTRGGRPLLSDLDRLAGFLDLAYAEDDVDVVGKFSALVGMVWRQSLGGHWRNPPFDAPVEEQEIWIERLIEAPVIGPWLKRLLVRGRYGHVQDAIARDAYRKKQDGLIRAEDRHWMDKKIRADVQSTLREDGPWSDEMSGNWREYGNELAASMIEKRYDLKKSFRESGDFLSSNEDALQLFAAYRRTALRMLSDQLPHPYRLDIKKLRAMEPAPNAKQAKMHEFTRILDGIEDDEEVRLRYRAMQEFGGMATGSGHWHDSIRKDDEKGRRAQRVYDRLWGENGIMR